METPDVQPVLTHPHYGAAPPDVGAELWVPEEPADKAGHLVLTYRQMNKAIGRVTNSLLIEVVVAREERGPRQLMKQHDDSVIRHPLVPHVGTDLTHTQAPPSQKLPL